MYNSPIHYCPECKEWVALDQQQKDCAAEQDCKVKNCPLAHLFQAEKTLEPTEKDGAGTGYKNPFLWGQ